MSEEGVPRQLQAILDILGRKVDELWLETTEAGRLRSEVVSWLYRVLDTLDNKTGQQLGFVALLLAAEVFLAGVIVGNQQTPRIISILVLVLPLLPAWVAFSSLKVFAVEWRFFGYVRGPGELKVATCAPRLIRWLFARKKRTAPAEGKLADRLRTELWELAKVCDKRVEAISWCYVLCRCSTVGFAITLALAVLDVVVFFGRHTCSVLK